MQRAPRADADIWASSASVATRRSFYLLPEGVGPLPSSRPQMHVPGRTSDEHVLVRSLALLQITAACIAFGGALLISATGMNRQGLILTALAAALFGAALLRARVEPGARWLGAAGILSTLFISLYIYFGGEPALPFALFYAVAAGATVWCASIRATVVQVLAMLLMCSVAVWTSPEPGQQPWPALAAADLGALIMLCIALSALTVLMWRFKRRYIESDRRAALLVEFSRDAIVGVDGQGAITTWNQGAEALYGYKRSEALGRNISILFPKVPQGDERETLRRVLGGEVIEGKRVERITVDGSARKISLSLSPITDENGTVTGAVGINRDVTAEVLANERLALQAAMIDEVDGAVIATDGAGTVAFWSAGAERLFGYPADAIIGRQIESLVGPDQAANLGRILEARDSGESLEGELDAVTRSGQQLPVFFRTRRVLTGEPTGRVAAITVVVDITARREALTASRRNTEAQQEIADLGRRALRGESCEELFARAVGVAVRVLSAHDAVLLERRPADEALTTVVASDGHEEQPGQNVADQERWLAEHVLRTRKATVVDDWEREPRLRGAHPLPSESARSSVAVAVGDADAPFGVLVVNQARPGGGLGDGVAFLSLDGECPCGRARQPRGAPGDPAAGAARLAHRASEPRPVPGPGGASAGAHGAGWPAAGGAHVRHRQVQDRQREPRPCDGR